MSLSQVFQTIEDKFKTTALGPDRWYIAAAATLVGGNDPELCGDLYQHLIAQPEFSSPAQRQRLVRRIRETLVKSVCIVGVCKPLEAILAISKLERPEDKDLTVTREGWQCDEANLQRGKEWLGKIYAGDTSETLKLFADHGDFNWISQNITYGLYLSDRTVLDDVETELVVLPGIMIQNLKLETHWHIRGIRRIGVSSHDTQVVWDSVQLIAEYLGIKLNRVPTVESVRDV
ncbi:carboxymuconolactone decarboxylase [Sarocladium implicatum]|nr:carboxymuconolactone decarboxylase [Sarocladium implicatum]